MHILLTIASFVAFAGCFWALMRCWTAQDNAEAADRTAHEVIAKLRAERDRVTVAERELDALRRELRKLSGKFYASQREREWTDDELQEGAPQHEQWIDTTVETYPVCQNWADAKQLGPTSEAAKCECLYCMTQRADRARTRAALVPKGAQATAATAKLNAGKP